MTGALRIADVSREAPVPHGAGDDANEDVVAHDRGRRTGLITPIAASRAVRVMIADGQELVRAGFRLLLEGTSQIRVVGEARSCDEALDVALRVRPDVVVVDANLPGGDSVAVAGRLRAESGAAVMLLTDSENDERTLAALRVGVSGLLLKDTEPGELVRAVETLARRDVSLSPAVVKRLIAELVARPEPGRPTDERLDELTRREREVVEHVALGLSNNEIAKHLVVTPATAKTHVSRAMIKLHARDRAQLVVFAYQSGLMAPPADGGAHEANAGRRLTRPRGGQAARAL